MTLEEIEVKIEELEDLCSDLRWERKELEKAIVEISERLLDVGRKWAELKAQRQALSGVAPQE